MPVVELSGRSADKLTAQLLTSQDTGGTRSVSTAWLSAPGCVLESTGCVPVTFELAIPARLAVDGLPGALGGGRLEVCGLLLLCERRGGAWGERAGLLDPDLVRGTGSGGRGDGGIAVALGKRQFSLHRRACNQSEELNLRGRRLIQLGERACSGPRRSTARLRGWDSAHTGGGQRASSGLREGRATSALGGLFSGERLGECSRETCARNHQATFGNHLTDDTKLCLPRAPHAPFQDAAPATACFLILPRPPSAPQHIPAVVHTPPPGLHTPSSSPSPSATPTRQTRLRTRPVVTAPLRPTSRHELSAYARDAVSPLRGKSQTPAGNLGEHSDASRSVQATPRRTASEQVWFIVCVFSSTYSLVYRTIKQQQD